MKFAGIAIVSNVILFSLLLNATNGMSPAEAAAEAEHNAHLNVIKANQFGSAIRLYSISIRLAPNRATTYLRRGQAYCGGTPPDPDMIVRPVCEEYFGLLDLDKAMADFTKAIRLFTKPEDKAEAYRCRGRVYSRKSQWDKAVADFSEAIRLEPKAVRWFSTSVSVYIERGNAWMNRGDTVKAIADYAQAIRLFPSDGNAYWRRIKAYRKAGEWDKVIDDCTKALRLNFENYPLFLDDGGNHIDSRPQSLFYWERGHAYRKKGEKDKALADYRAAMQKETLLTYNGFYDRDARYFPILESIENSPKDSFHRFVLNYTAMIQMDSKQPLAFWHRGQAYLELGQWDKAIADFSEMLRLDPKSQKTYWHRGVAYLQSGEADKTVADLTEFLRLLSKHDQVDEEYALSNRATAYRKLAQWDQAIADYTKAMELDANLGEVFHKDYYRERGEAFLKKGDQDKAIADYKSALLLDPNGKGFDKYRNLNWRRSELQEILDQHAELIRLAPDFARAYCNRANILLLLGQTDKAIVGYSEAIRLDPEGKTQDACLRRGDILRERGEWDKAIADYTDWIRLHRDTPKSPDLPKSSKAAPAYFGRAKAYLKKGEDDHAAADLKQYLEWEPYYAEPYCLLADIYIRRDKPDEAVALFTRAMKKVPNWEIDAIYCGRGKIFAKLGDKEKALADFTKAIDKCPLSAWKAYLEQGELLREKERLDEAIDDYSVAIALRPDAAQAYWGRANALQSKGHLEKAYKDFEQANKLGFHTPK